jgi:hypothetical protein
VKARNRLVEDESKMREGGQRVGKQTTVHVMVFESDQAVQCSNSYKLKSSGIIYPTSLQERFPILSVIAQGKL